MNDHQLRIVHLAIVEELPFASVSDISKAMAESTSSSSKTNAVVGKRRVPGSYGKHKLTASVVPFGHASSDVCETIFRTMLAEYGLSGLTQDQRETFIWSLAEVLIHGTSTEIKFDNVWFTFNGTSYTMATAASVCGRYIGLMNPVRVWTRDFRESELPMRMFEILNTADNLELRQVAAANYGTTVDNARFCFDTSSALLNSGMLLSHSDIALIGLLSAYTITRAQADGQSRGETQATSNHAGTVGGTRGAATAPAAPAVSSTERAGFKSLRG